MIQVVLSSLKIGTIGVMSLLVVLGGSHFFEYYQDKNIPSDTGKAVSMTIWESEDAMSDSEAGGEQRRRERTDASGAAVESVDHYEVGLIAVAPGVRPAGRRPEPVEEPGEEMVA